MEEHLDRQARVQGYIVMNSGFLEQMFDGFAGTRHRDKSRRPARHSTLTMQLDVFPK
jgi:hypothetical protein